LLILLVHRLQEKITVPEGLGGMHYIWDGMMIKERK